MLFTSWRDEITDLLGNCASYQEHYLQCKNTIDEQMKCYAICSEDLDAIQDQLNNVEDNDGNYDLGLPQEHKTLSVKMRMKVQKTFIQNSMKPMTYLVILEFLQLHLILNS